MRIFNKIRNVRLFWFLKNLCVFFRCDLFKEIEELKIENKKLRRDFSGLWYLHELEKNSKVKDEVLDYFSTHREESKPFEEELRYIACHDSIVFPYESKVIEDIVVNYDEKKKKLPFVFHKGKRLYFPSSFSSELISFKYRTLICSEKIIDVYDLGKAPHQYQSEFLFVEEGDVFVDVGCAEALLSLDIIEKVSKVYLVEADPNWIPALEATFEPYKDKVCVINKYISSEYGDGNVMLSSLLKNEKTNRVFVKMDIEGLEYEVLKSSEDFIKENKNIVFSCCTYHKDHDYNKISNFFDACGYDIEASSGYMLFIYDNLKPPYFRKGMIRAKRK